jgi:ankyrin repeat protein
MTTIDAAVFAVENDEPDVVRAYLAAGHDPDACNAEGWGLLATAAALGRVEIIRLLAAAGADLSGSRGDRTALFNAVRYGHSEVVEMLLAAGWPPDRTGDSLHGPHPAPPALIAAIQNHRRALALRLIAAGADPNAADPISTCTPLYAASDDLELVRALLTAGADPNRPCYSGLLPIDAAVMKEASDCFDLLVAAGSRLDTITDYGEHALHTFARTGDVRAIGRLVRAGAPVDVANGVAQTPLMCAAEAGQRDAARALLAAGADRSRRDGNAKTAADHAREGGHAELANEVT